MTISESTTVAELAAAVPSSVRVFQRHGIDFCCGGGKPLAVACEELGLDFAAVAADIRVAAMVPTTEDRDWTRASLDSLVHHIVTTYHEPLREELPRLETMAARVAQVHGTNAPYLRRVEGIVRAFAADLIAHMANEEAGVFSAIRALESRTADGPAVSASIESLQREHEHAGELLGELRRITQGYVAPEWACQTFRSLYHGLHSIEVSMHRHVHLENNVLFPRALRQAGELQARVPTP